MGLEESRQEKGAGKIEKTVSGIQVQYKVCLKLEARNFQKPCAKTSSFTIFKNAAWAPRKNYGSAAVLPL